MDVAEQDQKFSGLEVRKEMLRMVRRSVVDITKESWNGREYLLRIAALGSWGAVPYYWLIQLCEVTDKDSPRYGADKAFTNPPVWLVAMVGIFTVAYLCYWLDKGIREWRRAAISNLQKRSA